MRRTVGWILVLLSLACDATEEPDEDGGVDASSNADAGCDDDGDCDDGAFCTGLERCEGGSCRAGSSPCTNSCDEAADACTGEECATPDADGDGTDSIACGGEDCDDTDPVRFPGATEVCDVAGVDEDCDGTTFGARDRDLDGHIDFACCNAETCGEDCDDLAPGVHRAATEACNGVDDDCDARIDEGVMNTYYRDADMDGHGVATDSVTACMPPAGYAGADNDCDDAAPARNPGAPEACDSIDNDCDERIDEMVVAVLYFDADGDGFGNAAMTMPGCLPGGSWVTTGTDCNDTSSSVHPAATEVCNGANEDCDARIDEGALRTYHRDLDDDGYGVLGAATTMGCAAPAGYAEAVGDCDDATPSVHPGATELCDGLDTDCAGGLGFPGEDNDGDGHGDAALCTGAPAANDCDDTRADVRPGATELPADAVDQNCDGAELCFADADDDGHRPNTTATSASADLDCTDAYEAVGTDPATDCCDTDPRAHPGAGSVAMPARGCGGGFDFDCDGTPTPRWTAVSNGAVCPVNAGSICSTASRTEGWLGGVPACGVQGTWTPVCRIRTVMGITSCDEPTLEMRTQECR